LIAFLFCVFKADELCSDDEVFSCQIDHLVSDSANNDLIYLNYTKSHLRLDQHFHLYAEFT